MKRPGPCPRRSFVPLLLLVTILSAAVPLGAAADSPGAAPRDSAAVLADSSSAGGDTTVAGSAQGRPAARDYLEEARAGYSGENRSYQSLRVALDFIEPAYSLLIGLLILFSGLAAKFRDVAHGLGSHRWVRVLVFLTLYSLTGFALEFPLLWYQGFAVEHQYGLSTQSLGSWLADQGKAEAVTIVSLGVLPITALAYWLIEKSPRRWWLWLALGTLPVIVFFALVEPVAIDPLYNRFTPLRDQTLRERIVALARRAEIPARRVYEVDMSTRTIKYNAYVNGFGASQRIVIWDTTLQGMATDEILFVVGHEMGHYRLGHVWKGIVFLSLLSFAAFWLCAVISRAALGRFGGRWGIGALHDVASMPVLTIALGVVSLAATPVVNGYSRWVEHQADTFAIELTRDNDAGARCFLKMGAQNRSDPDPPRVIEALLYDHPPTVDRVRYALEYRPWERGAVNRAFRGAPAPP